MPPPVARSAKRDRHRAAGRPAACVSASVVQVRFFGDRSRAAPYYQPGLGIADHRGQPHQDDALAAGQSRCGNVQVLIHQHRNGRLERVRGMRQGVLPRIAVGVRARKVREDGGCPNCRRVRWWPDRAASLFLLVDSEILEDLVEQVWADVGAVARQHGHAAAEVNLINLIVTARGFESASAGLRQFLQFPGSHNSIVNFYVDYGQQICDYNSALQGRAGTRALPVNRWSPTQKGGLSRAIVKLPADHSGRSVSGSIFVRSRRTSPLTSFADISVDKEYIIACVKRSFTFRQCS